MTFGGVDAFLSSVAVIVVESGRKGKEPVRKHQTLGSRSTNGGGEGYRKFVPVLVGDDTKIAPTEDTFNHPSD